MFFTYSDEIKTYLLIISATMDATARMRIIKQHTRGAGVLHRHQTYLIQDLPPYNKEGAVQHYSKQPGYIERAKDSWFRFWWHRVYKL